MIDITYLYLAMVLIKGLAGLWAGVIMSVAAFCISWVSFQMTRAFILGDKRK